MNAYELQRAERIARNKEELQRLQVPQLGKVIVAPPRPPPAPRAKSAPAPTQRTLRSAAAPASSHVQLEEDEPVEQIPVVRRKPNKVKQLVVKLPGEPRCLSSLDTLLAGADVYTDEHEAKLGSCSVPWEGEMGVAKDRGDDAGITCHQCRQCMSSKKVEFSPTCSECRSVQLCGFCIQSRYGENIRELASSWVCPVCRDICNCSFSGCLRRKRGWPSTGSLRRFVLALRDSGDFLRGASAAHLLVKRYRKG